MRTRTLDWGIGLTLLGLVLIGTTLLLGFFWAPLVTSEGWSAREAYRILYWHVPVAWNSYIAFGMLFVGSLAWFWKRREWGWRLHIIGAELGLLYGLCVITSGPIWGQAEWGLPWDWADVRLNTYALLTALAAYLVFARRGQPLSRDMRDTLCTIGLFGFLLVPLSYMATRIWVRRHPEPVLAGDEDSGLDPTIRTVLLFGALSFTILLIGQSMLTWEVQKAEERLEELQRLIDERSIGS
jgi:heme exporter protein C